MNAYAAPLLLLIGLIGGAAAVWLLRGREIARAEAARDEARRRSDSLAAELQGEKIARAAAEASASADRSAHEDKLASLTVMRGKIETELKALAADALRGNQASFLSLAEQVFEKHKQAAATLIGEKEKAIAGLLAPIQASLEEYRKGVSEIEKARLSAYGGLAAEMQGLARVQADAATQTRRLVTALRAAPKTRGRWGEQQLHNVLELSGMTAHIDFVTEQTITQDETRLRPDVIIRLPGDRRIVVDAKTSMAAYLDAVEAEDEDGREAHLQHHARQLRSHMKQLAAKAYWEALPVTPDYVVMFIPGENFFAAAIERDPHLFEDAVAARVLIVTPTTLIALAKAIALGWRQEKIAENARAVATQGRELYQRLKKMGGHVVDLGRGLESAVKNYNAFVGSLESRVLPQARKFTELEIEGTQEPLPELRMVEIEARQLRADSALLAPAAGLAALPAGGAAAVAVAVAVAVAAE